MFAGKHGFITLRDLFRWAERYRLSPQTNHEYDWLQHLANDGIKMSSFVIQNHDGKSCTTQSPLFTLK